MLIAVFLAVTSCIFLADGRRCPAKYARFSTNHSFCLPPNGKCHLLNAGVDAEAKKEILRVHNQLRSKVAMGNEKQAGGLPTASNMMEMEWDDELARIAQRWTLNCDKNHDCNDCRAVEGFSVGQNLAQQSASGCEDIECIENALKPDWEGRINAWYSEVESYNRDLVENFKSADAYGHFTQVIWATSWRVGCGYTASVDDSTEIFHRYYACNYGPAGNVKNGAVYKTGKPCTGCPSNTCCGNCAAQDPTSTGLCQVVNKTLGPLNESKREGTIVDCNWKRGEPTCKFQVDGKQDWTIKPSLGGGSYYSIILNGGEKSSLKLTTPIQPTKDRFCLVIVFRKSPADAANTDSSDFVADLSTGSWLSKVPLKTPSKAFFIPYSIIPSWSSKTEIVLKFSVPKNAPEHILDLKEIVAYDGTCQKYTMI